MVSASDFGSQGHGFEFGERWTSTHTCSVLNCIEHFSIFHCLDMT